MSTIYQNNSNNTNNIARRRRSPSPSPSLIPIDEESPVVDFDCGNCSSPCPWDDSHNDDGDCFNDYYYNHNNDYRKTTGHDTHIDSELAATVAMALFLIVAAVNLGFHLGRLELLGDKTAL